MEKENYRHGDVVIVNAIIPTKALDQNSKTLAEGEVTGHYHKIVGGEASIFKFDDKFYLKVNSEIAKIDHPEHGMRDIAKGDYEIIIHKEWQEDGWESVLD